MMAISMIVLNCLVRLGDIVKSTTMDIRMPERMKFQNGNPFWLTRAKMPGKSLSFAAARADSEMVRVQPMSEPPDLRMAQSAMMVAPHGPTAFSAARAKGAGDCANCSAGIIPKRTVQVITYRNVAMARPMRVASGILRLGFSMTLALTAALSTP